MEIQFDVTIHVTQEFIDHQYMHYEDGYAPSAREVVRSVLDDIDGSHRFGIARYVRNYSVTHDTMELD